MARTAPVRTVRAPGAQVPIGHLMASADDRAFTQPRHNSLIWLLVS